MFTKQMILINGENNKVAATITSLLHKTVSELVLLKMEIITCQWFSENTYFVYGEINIVDKIKPQVYLWLFPYCKFNV